MMSGDITFAAADDNTIADVVVYAADAADAADASGASDASDAAAVTVLCYRIVSRCDDDDGKLNGLMF